MSVPCRHWSAGVKPVTGGGCCALGLFGGRPSVGVCLRVCEQYDGPARGAGDLVHAVAMAIAPGLAKRCRGCGQRRRRLNAALPLRTGP